eukprot:TRINITY_DN1515_c0_g1_i2.p2 TRINITY_DN1515_c0_g1~~TRINITY_DN1515_c0_g1_i2.p2  ORF type:complete len:124 (+),score=0.62 TRINITY_DN1515_c0_g1_i2:263-634(+)
MREGVRRVCVNTRRVRCGNFAQVLPPPSLCSKNYTLTEPPQWRLLLHTATTFHSIHPHPTPRTPLCLFALWLWALHSVAPHLEGERCQLTELPYRTFAPVGRLSFIPILWDLPVPCCNVVRQA